MGIDYIPDQEFNLLSGIFTSLGVEEALAAQLAAYAGLGIGIALVSVSISKTVIRKDMEKTVIADRIVNNLIEKVQDEYLKSFDELMEYIDKVLFNKFVTYYNLDVNLARSARTKKIISDLQLRLEETKQTIYELSE